MLSYLVRCSNCYLFQIFTVWFRKRQCYLIWSDALSLVQKETMLSFSDISDIYSLVQKETMLSYLVRCSNCYLFQIFTVWFRKRQCYLIWSDALIAIFFRYLQFGSERDNAILLLSFSDISSLVQKETMLSYLVRCSNCYLFQIFTVWFRKRQCYLIWSDALIAIFFRYLQFGSERDNAILFGQML